MQKFSFKRFLGMNTIKSPTNIPDNMAVDMRDMEIKRGLVRSRNGFLKHNLTGLGARITGIYQFRPKFKYFPPIISQDDTLEVVARDVRILSLESYNLPNYGESHVYPADIVYIPSENRFYFMAVDGDNYVLMGRMDGDGTNTEYWGAGYFCYGQNYFWVGIDYDFTDGYFYVGDAGNSRIVKTKWGGVGWTILGGFNSPSRVSYDASTGYIYVIDKGNDCIVKTKIDGSGWTTYGSSGSGVGQFYAPEGISYDASTDYIYVADTHNYRIVKTKIDGSGWITKSSYPVGASAVPTDICYDNDTGYIYTITQADTGDQYVARTKMDTSDWKAVGSAEGLVFNGFGMGCDFTTGHTYIANNGNYPGRIISVLIDWGD